MALIFIAPYVEFFRPNSKKKFFFKELVFTAFLEG